MNPHDMVNIQYIQLDTAGDDYTLIFNFKDFLVTKKVLFSTIRWISKGFVAHFAI